jgi:hypothetical protein
MICCVNADDTSQAGEVFEHVGKATERAFHLLSRLPCLLPCPLQPCIQRLVIY